MSLATLSITIPVPCVQGFFGNRVATYTSQIPALDIESVLGHDPRSRNWKQLTDSTRAIYEKIQRKTDKGRRDGVAAYIDQRFGPRNMIGAFPAISIGITQPTKFEPLAGEPAIGKLLISTKGHRILLDGLGRVTGCLDYAELGDTELAIVQKLVLPVTFYVPAPGNDALTVEDMGQLFMDFNFRVHPVPSQMAIALDQSDIYIGLTNQLAKEPFIYDNGGMEVKAKSLGAKSSSIVVQSVLLRTVRGACEGRDFQESNLAIAANPNLTEATYQHELQSIAGFFSEIAGRMGHRWVPRDSLHLTAPGWQALGVLHYDMNHAGLSLSATEKTHIYNVIGSLDWSRNNKAWVDEAKLGLWMAPKGGTTEQVVILGAGRNNTEAILGYLRRITGLQPKLEALQQKVAATA